MFQNRAVYSDTSFDHVFAAGATDRTFDNLRESALESPNRASEISDVSAAGGRRSYLGPSHDNHKQNFASQISGLGYAGPRDTEMHRRYSSDKERLMSVDAQGGKVQEAIHRQNRRKWRAQAVVISLSLFRFYLLGMLELNNQIDKISGSRTNISVLIGSFSFLIFGQIIDN